MFVVEVVGKFSRKNEDYFLDGKGVKTPYLSKAQTFPTKELGQTAGEAAMKAGRCLGFSVEKA